MKSGERRNKSIQSLIRFSRIGSIVLIALFAACSSESKKTQKPLTLSQTIDQKVQQEMSLHEDNQLACFADYQKRRGVIYGDLAFQFEVLKGGVVSWIKVREDKSNIHDPEFRRCMAETIKKIKFPELAERPVVIEAYPFHFRR